MIRDLINNLVRPIVSSNTFFYMLWFYTVRIRRGSRVKLPNKLDDLYFDGYPRSGNTFFIGLVERLYPEIKYSSHLHTIAGIKIAFRRKVPVFILIRYPADAIISNVFRISRAKGLDVNQKLLDEMIRQYYDYYAFVLKNKKSIKVLNFDELINDERLLMNELTSTLDLKKYSEISFKNILEKNEEIMRNLEKNKDIHVSSMGNNTRRVFKNEYLGMVHSSKFFDDVCDLYNKLIS